MFPPVAGGKTKKVRKSKVKKMERKKKYIYIKPYNHHRQNCSDFKYRLHDTFLIKKIYIFLTATFCLIANVKNSLLIL